jgi:hypothetical protein
MKVAEFPHGDQVRADSLTADDAFWGGDQADELYIRVWGLPDPDPESIVVMRLTDNTVSGLGADTLVETVAGEFVPSGAGPKSTPPQQSTPPAVGGGAPRPATPPAVVPPTPPPAPGRAAPPPPAPGRPAPPPAPQRRGRR